MIEEKKKCCATEGVRSHFYEIEIAHRDDKERQSQTSSRIILKMECTVDYLFVDLAFVLFVWSDKKDVGSIYG